MQASQRESFQGALAASLAFLLWGLIPVYWKLLQSVNAFELVLHRVFWSFLFLVLLVKARGRWALFVAAFRDRRMVRFHAMGGILLAVNWLAFIFAVTHEQVLQASLAYFIVPLVNSLLGRLVLKEELSRLRVAAIVLAGIGVLNEIIQLNEVPWLALVMAASFGCYGLLKKKTTLGTVTGLTLENTFIFPLAAAGLVFLFLEGKGIMFHGSWNLQVLILLTGIITSIPLLLFSFGAAKVQLNTLGILQFITPLVKFGLAVWLFHEPFSSAKLLTFATIWIGLAVYLWDSFHRFRIKDVQPDL